LFLVTRARLSRSHSAFQSTLNSPIVLYRISTTVIEKVYIVEIMTQTNGLLTNIWNADDTF